MTSLSREKSVKRLFMIFTESTFTCTNLTGPGYKAKQLLSKLHVHVRGRSLQASELNSQPLTF